LKLGFIPKEACLRSDSNVQRYDGPKKLRTNNSVDALPGARCFQPQTRRARSPARSL